MEDLFGDLTQWLLTDRGWADVLLDTRSLDAYARRATLPDSLPTTTEPYGLPTASTRISDGVLEPHLAETVPFSLAPPHRAPFGRTPLMPRTGAVHGAVVEFFTLTNTRSGGHLLIRVTYGDGFTIASVSQEQSDMDGIPPAALWDEYLAAPREGFSLTLLGGRHRMRAAAANAAALRGAVESPFAWFAGESLPMDGGLNPALEMFRYASLGFTDYRVARRVSDGRVQAWDTWMGAIEAGFRLDSASDVDWLTTADANDWMLVHDSWENLVALRDAGWTVQALDALHTPEVASTVVSLTQVALREGRHISVHDIWVEVSRADEWVHLAGNPKKVSACIAAGVSLHEVRTWVQSGSLPDDDTLRVLAALRHA